MRNPKPKGRAIGYIRVSTEQQRESGLGLDAQRATLAEAAVRLSLELATTYADAGLSGSLRIEDRPGLADALQALRRGDTLLVAKRDRLARDSFLAVLIERQAAKKGARIVSAAGEGTDSDEPGAIFTRRILDAVSELERAITAARTRAALRAKRARGERAGGEPYGYRVGEDGKTLHDHGPEQLVLRRILDRRAAGYPLRAIARELNDLGHRTRRGSAWRWEYVRSALQTVQRNLPH